MGAPTEIERLHVLSSKQLQVLWQKLYGKAAPGGIRREFMTPFLAYRIQEKAYGGLKPSTRSELRRIARGLENTRLRRTRNTAQNQIRDPPYSSVARRNA